MSFKAFNISNAMISSLTRQGYLEPSSIQSRSIPLALKGKNLMVQSATGSGKTLCYLIPIIDKINYNNKKLQSIIVAPTRELAQQIYNCAVKFNPEFPKLKVRLMKAGEEIDSSLKGLTENPHILIGTPGRLKDILVEHNALSSSNVNYVVFDEADMLLKEGFFNEIDEFMSNIKNAQFMVFSATLENNLASILDKYIGSNELINEKALTSGNVNHYLVDIKHIPLNEAVESFIKIINPYLLLIFASKKETANKIYSFLKNNNYKVGLLTGDLSSRERKNVMKLLNQGKIYILVCSDMVARGLDIQDVSDILNVDLPNNLEFYYHRAGRTGRFNKNGNCYTFYNSDSAKKPMLLINENVDFKFLILKDGQFIEGKGISKSFPKKKNIDPELKKEIKKIQNVAKGKKDKVKPGYKKKVKEEIEKAKRKHRREIIKKDIRRQRVARYKKESKNNG